MQVDRCGEVLGRLLVLVDGGEFGGQVGVEVRPLGQREIGWRGTPRALVQRRGLPVRRHPRRVRRREECVPVGDVGQVRPLVVVGDVGVAVLGDDRGDACRFVQPAPPARRNALVDRVADHGMAEVEVGAVARRDDDLPVEQFGEAGVEFVDRFSDGSGEHVDVERPPDDGRGIDQGAGARAECTPTEHDRLGDRPGHAADRAGRDELFHVQRDPVAARVELVQVDRREHGARDRLGELGRHRAVEPPHVRFFRESLSDEPVAPLPQRRAGEELFCTVRGEHQRVGLLERRGHPFEHVEAQLVGPVQVFQAHQRRPASAEHLEEDVGEVGHEHPAPARAVPTFAAGEDHRPQSLGRSCVAGAAQVRCQFEEHSPDDLGSPPESGRADAVPDPGETLGDIVEEPRLADPGLAGEQEQMAGPGDRGRPPPLRESQQVVAPDRYGRDPDLLRS